MEKIALVCQDCGSSSDDVKETVCPFALDVHNEEVEVTLCDSCEHERAMDI